MLGNRVTEKDIRNWLEVHGFCGKSAIFEDLTLHAIQRPGWLQIFRFSLKAKSKDGKWETLHGAVRDDERKRTLAERTVIVTFAQRESRDIQLAEWSKGLIYRGSGEAGSLPGTLLLFAVLIALILFFLYWFQVR